MLTQTINTIKNGKITWQSIQIRFKIPSITRYGKMTYRRRLTMVFTECTIERPESTVNTRPTNERESDEPFDLYIVPMCLDLLDTGVAALGLVGPWSLGIAGMYSTYIFGICVGLIRLGLLTSLVRQGYVWFALLALAYLN